MGQRVCILGLGVSGVAAARHAQACGDDVTIYAGASSEATRAASGEFTEAGIGVIFDDEAVRGHYDLTVACPGIPQTCAFYRNALAASDELVSEPEYAWRFSPQGWVAVTGTNGKTTTTSLIAHILNASGLSAQLCGNTQRMTVTECCESRGPGTMVVAELSSFQLASTRCFKPQVAVLLNIGSDHLSWHGSQQAYAHAKLKIVENLGEGQTAVIADCVEGAEGLAKQLRARGVRVWRVGEHARSCAYMDADGALRLVDDRGQGSALCSADDLQVKGPHNVVDACAAACAAIECGCTPAQVAAALVTFEPLAHRLEHVATVDGVSFVDDSKATNADAVVSALASCASGSIVLLAGGVDKGADLTELAASCARACVAAVCYGQAAARLSEAFEAAGVRVERAHGMRDAFEAACALAQPGMTVLLSPACASFDEFDGFAQRGDAFKGLVADYAGGR